MAATDMRRAGLEPACRVICSAFDGDPQPGTVVSLYTSTGEPVPAGEPASGAVVRIDSDAPAAGELNIAAPALQRDYGDAQRARRARVDVLAEEYEGDWCPESTDTIERFVGVMTGDGGGSHWWAVFADTFDEVAELLADAMMTNGDQPYLVLDLDTGAAVQLAVRVTVYRSDDQAGGVAVPDLSIPAGSA